MATEEKGEIVKNYLKHILSIGNDEEQKEILQYIKTKFLLTDGPARSFLLINLTKTKTKLQILRIRTQLW